MSGADIAALVAASTLHSLEIAIANGQIVIAMPGEEYGALVGAIANNAAQAIAIEQQLESEGAL